MTTIWIDRNGLGTSHVEEAVARKTIAEGARGYFIMVTAEGRLFNPNDATASLTEKDKERGGPKYVLRRCNEDTYQRYVEFLTTRNKANLLVAERGFINERK